MKTISALARKILLFGTLFPTLVCACYIALLYARGTDFRFDFVKRLVEVTETVFLCVLVSVGGAFLADAAWREQS